MASTATTFGDFRIHHGPRLVCRIRTDTAVTLRRQWCAIVESAVSGLEVRTTAAGSAASAIDFAGVGFNTAVGADFKCCSGDGTNYSCTDTGVTVAVSTEYDIDVDTSTAGSVICRIGAPGAQPAVVTKATEVPVTTTVNMGPTTSITTLDATARFMDLAGYRICL